MANTDKASPAQIEKYLSGVDYPAQKDLLVRHAEQQGAPEDVRSVLNQLPAKEYQSPTDVSQGVGQVE
jgi:hypothetical protein